MWGLRKQVDDTQAGLKDVWRRLLVLTEYTLHGTHTRDSNVKELENIMDLVRSMIKGEPNA